ncbi:MAG: dihydroorotate dehydrogenase-like protein [Lentisphaeria bacterium]|jgi:dihydroorotate dehydrogenase (fumarate)
MDTAVRYLGLPLRNPFIVGAGPLTWSVKAVEACAAAGAAAVVLPSLFEEELRGETGALDERLAEQASVHAEASEFLRAGLSLQLGGRRYLQLIRDCKSAVGIPVIASLNCLSTDWWREFAGEVAAAGADALELNLAVVPVPGQGGREVEERYETIVRAARSAVRIPLAVKIAPWFSSLPEMALRLARAGADGLVLFNRFYQPEIDIERLDVKPRNPHSQPGEHASAMRWISLLAERIPADFAAASGIHSGADAIRLLLAGASAVQVVSALLKHGLPHLAAMREELAGWMARHRFEEVEAFRGRLCQERNPDRELFSRIHYRTALAARQPV